MISWLIAITVIRAKLNSVIVQPHSQQLPLYVLWLQSYRKIHTVPQKGIMLSSIHSAVLHCKQYQFTQSYFWGTPSNAIIWLNHVLQILEFLFLVCEMDRYDDMFPCVDILSLIDTHCYLRPTQISSVAFENFSHLLENFKKSDGTF